METIQMRVALYVRVSSEKQDVDLSVSGQLNALRKYAADHAHTVVREFADEAESGKSAHRPVFQQMVAEARQKPRRFDAVLVWKLSRFARSREDSILYKSLLKKHGVQVISMNEPIDNSPTGKMVEGMIEVIDEFYVLQMAQDIVRAMREAVSRGFWVGFRVPYGYLRLGVPDGRKTRSKLEPDAVTAPVVHRIFEAAATGSGPKEIASSLNVDGVPPAKGRYWSRGMVRRVLINPVYGSRLVWGKSGKYHQSYAMPPVEVAGACPAIIDEQLFRHARAQLAQRSQKVLPPRRAASPYLLSGMLRCGRCRKAMFGVPAKSGAYRYYTCSTAFRSGRVACSGKSIRQDVIERLAVGKIQELVLRPDHVQELVRLANQEAAGAAAEASTRARAIGARIHELQQRLDRLYDAVESGKVTLDDLAPRIKALRADLQMLEASRDRVTSTTARPGVVQIDENEVLRYLHDLEGLLAGGSLSERRIVLKSFVREIVRGEAEATVYYTLPLPPGKAPAEPDTFLRIANKMPRLSP